MTTQIKAITVEELPGRIEKDVISTLANNYFKAFNRARATATLGKSFYSKSDMQKQQNSLLVLFYLLQDLKVSIANRDKNGIINAKQSELRQQLDYQIDQHGGSLRISTPFYANFIKALKGKLFVGEQMTYANGKKKMILCLNEELVLNTDYLALITLMDSENQKLGSKIEAGIVGLKDKVLKVDQAYQQRLDGETLAQAQRAQEKARALEAVKNEGARAVKVELEAKLKELEGKLSEAEKGKDEAAKSAKVELETQLESLRGQLIEAEKVKDEAVAANSAKAELSQELETIRARLKDAEKVKTESDGRVDELSRQLQQAQSAAEQKEKIASEQKEKADKAAELLNEAQARAAAITEAMTTARTDTDRERLELEREHNTRVQALMGEMSELRNENTDLKIAAADSTSRESQEQTVIAQLRADLAEKDTEHMRVVLNLKEQLASLKESLAEVQRDLEHARDNQKQPQHQHVSLLAEERRTSVLSSAALNQFRGGANHDEYDDLEAHREVDSVNSEDSDDVEGSRMKYELSRAPVDRNAAAGGEPGFFTPKAAPRPSTPTTPQSAVRSTANDENRMPLTPTKIGDPMDPDTSLTKIVVSGHDGAGDSDTYESSDDDGFAFEMSRPGAGRD